MARRRGFAARCAGVLAALIAIGAATAPAQAAPFTASAKPGPADVPATDATMDDEDLPVPPIPPDLPAGAEAAPLPDFDTAAPLGAGGKQTAGLRPDVFRAKSYNRGDGYVNGSGDHDEGRFKQGPAAGFKLAVPLP